MKPKLGLTLALLVALLQGCDGCRDSCGCGDLRSANVFDIQSLRLAIKSSGFDVLDPVSDFFPLDASLLLLEIRVDDRIFIGQRIPARRWNWPVPIATAQACSPPPPRTDEVIDDIQISSNADFSANRPAGSELNGQFEVVYALVEQAAPFPMPLGDFIAGHYRSSEVLGLRLRENPTASKNHRFTIHYRHVGGETFVLTSPLLEFR